MASKEIAKRMTLKDQVTPGLSRINKGTVEYKRNLRDLKRVANNTWSGIKTGVMVAGAAFAGGVAGIVIASRGWEEAAKAQIEAETKLAAVLKNVNGITGEHINGLKAYATELQNVGVVGDEVQLAGIQQIGTYQLQADTIKTLMPGLADLVAQQKGLNATQGDAVTLGNMLGKAMTGQSGALSKAGINFDEAQKKILKFGTEQEKAAVLAEVLKSNVGGVNEAIANTDQGRIQQATNAIGDMKETLGTTVLFIKAKFAKAFMDDLPRIQSGIKGIADGVRSWAENGGIDKIINGMKSAWSAITDVWDVAVNTFNFFKDNWSTIGPIVYGIVAGLVAYKTALVVVRAWTLLTTAATLLWSGALKMTPIGWVSLAIGGLILVGTLLIKNWENVKLVGMKTWNVMVGAAEWAVNKYLTFANFMIRMYKFAWDSIKFAGISIWDGLVTAAEKGIQKMLEPINKVRDALGKDKINIDFSVAKIGAEKPKWDSEFNLIPKVDFSGAKFSEDDIMIQTKKAQTERDKKKTKKEDALIAALEANTEATGDNTDETGRNTGATNANTQATLKSGGSAEDISDGLLSRIDRHLWGTT